MSSQFQLMGEKRFRPFFFTQFAGAFNDNLFKTALITIVAFNSASMTSIDGEALTTLLPGLFILPFFLFSATAGQIADKFEKSLIIRYVKIFEIAIMLIASSGFFIHNITLLMISLFMMGMHSTILGPVKYAYLPQHLDEFELVGGNGMVEMGTFVAILLGQVMGAWISSMHQHEILTSLVVLTVASLGYISSRNVPNSPASDSRIKINWNPITETYKNLKFVWKNQTLWLAILAISWFWFYGATLLAQFPNFARETLRGNESVFIVLLSVFSIGVGVGSLMCEKLSKGKIELGLVLFGAIGLTFSGIDLYSSGSNIHENFNNGTTINYLSFLTVQHDSHGQLSLAYLRLLADVLFLGLFGGIYIVPLYARIQSKCEKTHQSRVIAANNIMNAFFMVFSAIFSIIILKLGVNITKLFFLTATLNLIFAIYICLRDPLYYKSFIKWISGHFIRP